MKLLCISNGHGEDVIALRILRALRQLEPEIQISALPISGAGVPYLSEGLEIVSPARSLPSGGFLNRDPKQLARDVKTGLLSLTRQQLKAVKSWAAAASEGDSILAVGDIVPLLFAQLSKAPYHFVGTAKSEYWLRDERGKLPASSLLGKLEGWSGSVYLPWERSLMSSRRCKSIFVRDALTAERLQSLGIRANYAGNPMMDNLAPAHKLAPLIAHLRQQAAAPPSATNKSAINKTSDTSQIDHPIDRATALYVTPKQQPTQPLTILLLPGSRQLEAYENWARILAAIPSLLKTFPTRPLILLGAIAPSLSLSELCAPLSSAWSENQAAGTYPTFTLQNIQLALVGDAYSDCLHQADIAIATAGTATEQFVGLGKPAITIPGNGPQFTPAFASVQAKMLGPSIQMVEDPSSVGEAISKIISDPDRLQLIYQNGTHRMGKSGAGQRIAQVICQRMKAVQ